MKNSQTKFAITHVFQSVTNREQASSTPFAATVLGGLLQEENVKSSSTFSLAVHQVTELSMNNKMVRRVAFQKLWDIVLELVIYTKDFTLIADGLDECDEKSGDELSRELRALSSSKYATHHPLPIGSSIRESLSRLSYRRDHTNGRRK